jgi:hypothetical protein
MPTRQKRYTGPLASPIIWRSAPPFSGAVTDERVEQYWKDYEEHQQQAQKDVDQQFKEKLSLLMDHYGLADKEDMTSLAMALACEHVPGFRIEIPTKTNKGRKRQWESDKLEDLLNTVESLQKKLGFNDRTALSFIVADREYAKTWGKPPTHKGNKQQWIETLESRLQEAKRIRKDAQRQIESLLEIARSLKFRE